MVYIIFIALAAPLIMTLFLTDGASRRTIGFMILGSLGAVFSYEINGLVKSLINLNDFYYTISAAPIVEETIKAIPPLAFAILSVRYKKRDVIGVSMAVGIGFALVENVYLLVNNYKSVSIFWALVRGFSTGLMHGITTAVVGYGMTFANSRKKLFYTGIFGLLCTAVTYHGIYNILVQSKYEYVGMVTPITTYAIIFFIVKILPELKKIRNN